MISVDINSKSYGSPILKDISFSIDRHECVAILGPSGIGKSTLIGIVAGIDEKFEGQVTRPGNVAMAFQEPTLLPWRSVLRNLTVVHPGLSNTAAIECLERVGMANKSDLFPGQLSLGQQRRVSLARAFAGRPDFLIMDEPFASLDHENAQAMLLLTKKLLAETDTAVLLVTHSLDEAQKLADRIYFLEGSPATLTQRQAT